MSSLPSGWTECALGDMGTWVGGGTPTKGQSRYWKNGTIPWVSPKDMKQATLHDAEDHITKVALLESATNLIPAGSVLFVARSGILRRTLPIAVTAVPVTINQDLKAIVPKNGVDANFLSWALRAHERQILHECSKTGTTVQSIEMPRMRAFTVPLPPFQEQCRIAAELDERVSNLDAAMAGLARAQANVRRLRVAALDEALREADAHPGRTVESLQSLATSSGYGISQKCLYRQGGLPVLRIPNVADGKIRLDDLKMATEPTALDASDMVCPGDLLVVRTNGSRSLIGRGAVLLDALPTPTAFASYLIRYRLRNDPWLWRWIAMIWNAPRVRRALESMAASSAGQFNLSVSKLDRVKLPVPPPSVADTLVRDTEHLLLMSERADAAIGIQLARAAQLRLAIMRSAFRGTLPSDRVPGDVTRPVPARPRTVGCPPKSARRKTARRSR